MTAPVFPSSNVKSGHVFESFDRKICQLIYTSLNEDLEGYIKKGLDPNYTLESDVTIEGILFIKGSSLLQVILQCCTLTSMHWELGAMVRLLLENGADVKKSLQPEGGGKQCFRICV